MSNKATERVLLTPRISEKANLVQAFNQYVFVVARETTKAMLVRALKEQFSVDAVAVNLLKMQGKKRNFRGIVGRRNSWKKAYVILKEGNVINLGEVK